MYKIDRKDNRVPSLPDGGAKVGFGISASGNKKVILDVPCWVTGYTKTGMPRTNLKNKRLTTSDAELVAKFEHAIDSGWFELDSQGNHVVDLINITYFDNSFQKDNAWINFSQLLTADIAPLAETH